MTAGNLEDAAARIERALAAGAVALSLPNLPLFGELLRDPAAVAPTAAQFEALAARIAAALRGRPGADLRVHHYGLWQLLRAAGVQLQGEGGESGGCQAGAARLDPAGILHPCASLPVPLAARGGGDAIRAAWAGAELAALREAIARLPERCAGCPAESTCRGAAAGGGRITCTTPGTPPAPTAQDRKARAAGGPSPP